MNEGVAMRIIEMCASEQDKLRSVECSFMLDDLGSARPRHRPSRKKDVQRITRSHSLLPVSEYVYLQKLYSIIIGTFVCLFYLQKSPLEPVGSLITHMHIYCRFFFCGRSLH